MTAKPDKAMLDFNFSNLETSDLGHTKTGAQSTRAGFDDLNIDRPDDIQTLIAPRSERAGDKPFGEDMGMDELQSEEQHAARSSETMLDLNDSGINDLQGLPSDSEVGTKLDLAKAYIDMGDSNGALSALEEVLKEGDNDQCKEAEVLKRQIA